MHDMDKFNERLYDQVAPIVKLARTHAFGVLFGTVRGLGDTSSSVKS